MKGQEPIIGIYKITNPKGKVYIGQSVNIERRWNEYRKYYCKKQPKLYFSLKKYGHEEHIFEIIEECDESIILQKETYWKEYYEVLIIPSLCCRIDGKGGRDSEETKIKKSQAHMGNKYNLGKSHTEETKLKISNKIKGTKRTEEQVKNMSKPRINKEIFKLSNTDKKIKTVIQFTKDGEFIKEWRSVKEAEIFLKVNNHTNISAAALGKQKTAWGYVWKYKN